jgi:BirA family biotin operon repressor/biotin-[acetyl-CoA-carboxylase] ligase
MRPLGQADLLPNGPLKRLGRSVHTSPEIDSTNAYLLSRVAELPDGAVAWAEFQKAGRGRQGRAWVAPRGSSILLSVLLHEPDNSTLGMHASHIACLAACEAIEQTTDCRPAVRWPNDVVLEGRKVGGVLTESRALPVTANALARRAVVIGIGINCFQQPGHFPPHLRNLATSLEIASRHPVQRAALAARLLERLDEMIVHADRTDWRAEWLRRCEDLGTRIRVGHDGAIWSGTIVEVAESGDLIVQLDDGARRQFASETTTRLEP